MANSKELFTELVNKITTGEDQQEVSSIVYVLLEGLLGFTRTDVLTGKPLPQDRFVDWDDVLSRINQHEPVQYILGEAWFCNRAFWVTPSVLIPRTETEGLVRQVIHSSRAQQPGTMIVDVGTGSGCIAVTLAAEQKQSRVFATDISAAALDIARENAKRSRAIVEFLVHNILEEDLPMSEIDVLVSNPPYITPAEEKSMHRNVLDHEPWLALFVPEDDPLIFYKAIAEKGMKALRKGGQCIVEINEQFGKEVSACFAGQGFREILVSKDFAGKDRFVSAVKG